MTYVDSSALVKLVLEEAETADVAAYLANRSTPFTTAIALVEVARAVARADPGADAAGDADTLLRPFALVEVRSEVLRAAAALAGELRSLDALHLASAHAVRADVMVVYDKRLRAAASAAGIDVVAPGE